MTYTEIGKNIGELVDRKNKQYGDSINSTAEFLKLLYPEGIPSEHYQDIGILVRIWDKLKRIAAGNNGDENAYEDVAGYGILMANKHQFSNLRCAKLSPENLQAAMDRIEQFGKDDARIKKISEAIASIKSNYPTPGTYTMLCEGLDLAIEIMEAEIERIQHGDRKDCGKRNMADGCGCGKDNHK